LPQAALIAPDVSRIFAIPIGPRGERVACLGGGDRAAKIISTREGRGATDRGEYRQAA
jgi:hypothetical protein